MGKAVQAVEEQIRLWRESPAEARRRLAGCARAFEQCAQAAEETLESLQFRPAPEAGESIAERRWRWTRKGYILFWAIAVALSLLALAAGYFAGFGA